MNTNAIILCAFSTCVGFLINHTLVGAVSGLAVGLGIIIAATIWSSR